MTTFLILAGLALFILRSQLLRVAIQQLGGKADPAKLHASPVLGAASGWASLAGAAALMLLALVIYDYLWGLVVIGGGIFCGVLLSSFALPIIGSTLVFGHHGGEGAKSIAALNRTYGAWVAFAVMGCALLGWGLHVR
jgi:hypothetical protein